MANTPDTHEQLIDSLERTVQQQEQLSHFLELDISRMWSGPSGSEPLQRIVQILELQRRANTLIKGLIVLLDASLSQRGKP